MRDAGKTVLTPLKQAKDRNAGHFLQGETADKILQSVFFFFNVLGNIADGSGTCIQDFKMKWNSSKKQRGLSICQVLSI